MADFLISFHLWIKAGHILAVISWMAGLLYLPRLFVYHAEAAQRNGATDMLFQTMEYRLLKAIMNPAMILTWIFGLLMAFTPGLLDFGAGWVWMKFAAVIAMTWFHMWLGKQRKKFIAGEQSFSGRQFRFWNELPTVLMIIIVISVIVRPF